MPRVGPLPEIGNEASFDAAGAGPLRKDGPIKPVRFGRIKSCMESSPIMSLRVLVVEDEPEIADFLIRGLREEGFVRAIWRGRSRDLTEHSAPDDAAGEGDDVCLVIVDRLAAGAAAQSRLRDSLETAFARGAGQATALVAAEPQESSVVEIDGAPWRRIDWSRRRYCPTCQREYPDPDERLLNFNSPAGACPTCEGFGNTVDIDYDVYCAALD